MDLFLTLQTDLAFAITTTLYPVLLKLAHVRPHPQQLRRYVSTVTSLADEFPALPRFKLPIGRCVSVINSDVVVGSRDCVLRSLDRITEIDCIETGGEATFDLVVESI